MICWGLALSTRICTLSMYKNSVFKMKLYRRTDSLDIFCFNTLLLELLSMIWLLGWTIPTSQVRDILHSFFDHISLEKMFMFPYMVASMSEWSDLLSNSDISKHWSDLHSDCDVSQERNAHYTF